MWEYWVNIPALLVLYLWQRLLLCCLSLDVLSLIISLSLLLSHLLLFFPHTWEQHGPEWAPNYVQVQPKTLPDSLSAWQTIICTHSDADCSVWQAIKSLWYLGSSCHYCAMNNLSVVSFYSTELMSSKVWHKDSHIACNIRLRAKQHCQGCLRGCGFKNSWMPLDSNKKRANCLQTSAPVLPYCTIQLDWYLISNVGQQRPLECRTLKFWPELDILSCWTHCCQFLSKNNHFQPS